MLSFYFLFDAARATEPNLVNATAINEHVVSLYKGRSEEALASVAPYIFSFPHSEEFSDFILRNGWGNSWGIFAYTAQSIEDIFHHFRKFLFIKTQDEKQFYFRFYDPRVLRIFLPICDTDQILEFFGPIEKFILEGEAKEDAMEFSHQNGKLIQRKINLEEVFGASASKPKKEELHLQTKKSKNKIIDDEPR
ncbi:MAG TPA: DUF4123 domain-containing protein [Puia sp.]|jgi:hypothetical protein|nr:DUF4123 domain-containing protein [Puia sp.]